jgi:phosphoribosyl 1,2-cyclic phosphodiesterase
MREAPFLVRIWGARGSLPAPAAPNCRFGSDTCCVEMRCGGRVLIFDAGSAAETLSRELSAEGVKDFDLFFSHCHFDHILGLPFLAPLYEDEVTARIYAGHFEDRTTCREMIYRFMRPPFFPITPELFRARIEFRDFRPPETWLPHAGIRISTVRLNHPNGCVGYRVDAAGCAVCYVTDTEHLPGSPDQALLALISRADAMIYDCTYTDDEFAASRGYGHSTWEEGVRLCEAAGVERLIIFHHRPGRDDNALQEIEVAAQARFPGAIVARSGLEVALTAHEVTVRHG